MARPNIDVDGLVWFNGTGDVFLSAAGRSAVEADPERLLDALRLAARYATNEILNQAVNGRGPLAAYDALSFEEFIVLLEEITSAKRQTEGARNAKITALKIRRSQFAANRAALILKLLAGGIEYRCAHPGCEMVDDLTVDHRMPISRGGTDDIDNLQFMCLPHNAAKGSRI